MKHRIDPIDRASDQVPLHEGFRRSVEMKPMGVALLMKTLPTGSMKNQFRDLQLQQMDAILATWKAAPLSKRPPSGWVRAIRESLGMSAAGFARRLGMSHAGVRKLEKAEASDAITLASLRKLAAALDCELQYALVPRTTLAQQVKDRAETVARERLRPIAHSMALEDQVVQGSLTELQLELAVKALLEGSRRQLW
jgi:predicted DNA-binding mobile mystery protein A